MAILLLPVIYIVFISLGLPDGLFGGAWPAIQSDLSLPLGYGGIIAFAITFMTVLSSLATPQLVRALGTGKLIVISTALTTISLLGYAHTDSLVWLFILALPLGLGAGAIDSAVNNYVAVNYKAHHMNWLHAFWGLGATLGPVIFAASLAYSGKWHDGYWHLGIIQGVIVAITLLSLPLWIKRPTHKTARKKIKDSYAHLLAKRPVRYATLTFMLYVGLEVSVGLWLASYLVLVQSLAIETASLWTGLYYGAITLGRVLTGVLSFTVSNTKLIRFGLAVAAAGIALLIPNASDVTSLIGVLLIGFGFAPIYPSLIHITPKRFGVTLSHKVMSLQMVGGYLGASIIPAAIGLAANEYSIALFSYVIAGLLVGVVLCSERLQRLTRKAL